MLCSICKTDNAPDASRCVACGVALTDSQAGADEILSVGTALQHGAYVIDRVLGQGGFGITYLGSDLNLNRAVAIKEFYPTGCYRKDSNILPSGTLMRAEFQEAKQRFLEEARTLARFRHPGIVNVFAAFEENNTAYMAMEFLQGKTLGALVQERGRLDEAEAVGYIREAGEALEVVHATGLLHRDIKPDNMMLCHDGRIVLIDFGTARDFAVGRTQGHTVVVTPGYAPLEQYAQRAQRGVFSDVYGLAATLYFILTGHAPVPATDRAAGVELVPPHLLVADVSQGVGEAIHWAMELKIEQRPQSVADFIGALTVGPEGPDSYEPASESSISTSNWPSWLIDPAPATRIPPNSTLSATTSISAVGPTSVDDDTVWVHGSTVTDIGLMLNWPQQCPCCGFFADSKFGIAFDPADVHFSGTRRWLIPYCSRCISHVETTQNRQSGTGIPEMMGMGLGLFFTAAISGLVSTPLPIIVGLAAFAIYKARQLDDDTPALWKNTGTNCCTPYPAVACVNAWREPDGSYVYTFTFVSPVYRQLFEQMNSTYTLTS